MKKHASEIPLSAPTSPCSPAARQDLLPVIRAIATIRERTELFTTIIEQIKPVLPVDDTGILILDKTGNYWQDWTNADNYQKTNAVIQAQQPGLDQSFPVDRWMRYVLNHSGIMSVACFMQQYPEHPFGPVMWEAGLREFIFTPLVFGGKKLGVLFFDAEKEGTYTEEHLHLFQSLAELLAIAVDNILANEEILQREREKAILLSISEDIAMVRNPVDLLSVINKKIKQLIPFYDTGVLIVEPNGEYHSDMAVTVAHWDASPGNLRLQAQNHNRIVHKGSFVEKTMQKLETLNSPLIENWNYLFDQYEYPFFEVMRQMGYQEALVTTLKSAGQTFGTLWLNSLQKGCFSSAQFHLFQAIADQVAVAVANILANEEINRREREKSQLLEISEAIARVQNSTQLLKVIYEKIKPVFPYDNAGLFVLDKTGHHFHEILDEEMLPDPVQTALTRASLLGRFSLQNLHPEAWVLSESPVIDSLANQAGYFDAQARKQFEVGMEQGLQQMIGGPLYCGGKKVGFLSFNSTQKNFYRRQHLPIFQAIADLVSVAVANLLVKEEMVARQQEKETLLSISEDIASVRNIEDLLSIIVRKIKPIFTFYDTGFLVLDKEKRTFRDLAVMYPGIDHSEVNLYLNDHGIFPQAGILYAGSLLETIINAIHRADGPVLFDYEEDMAGHSDSALVKTLKRLGYKEALTYHLKVGGDVFGCFFMNFNQKGIFNPAQFRLFRSITEQVSVAVANILANEEILEQKADLEEREREKALLLSLSENMATIRNRDDLWRVMMEKIRPLVDFADAVVITLSEDQSQYCHFLTASSAERKANPNYSLIVGPMLPIAGTPNEYLLTLGSPYVWHIEEMLERYPDYPGVHLCLETGLHHCVGFRLQWSDRLLGLFQLAFNHKEQIQPVKFPLYKAIADQVAVAVANILANEEILEREREKTLLLEISNGMAASRHWESRFSALTHLLAPFVPLDLFFVILDIPACPRYYTFTATGKESGPVRLQSSGFLSQTGLTAEEFSHLREGAKPLLAKPGHYTDREFSALEAQYGLIEVLGRQFGIRSLITLPLPIDISRPGDCGLLLANTAPEALTAAHFAFLQRIAAQVALITGKLLAFEDIQKREREKSLQLAVNQTLVSIKERDALFMAMATQISKVVPCPFFIVRIINTSGGTEYKVLLQCQASGQYVKVWESEDIPSPDRSPESENPPGVYVGHDFSQFCHQSQIYRNLPEKPGARSALQLKFPVNGSLEVIIVLADTIAFAYAQQDYQVLHQLLPQVSLALDNLFAFEKIASLQKMLENEKAYLLDEIKGNHNFEEIIGTSNSLREVLMHIRRVAPTDTTVLIGGETGTGKELIARAIHNLSARKGKVLVKVNCATLPPQLIESELFGHEKGAYTGATERRIGKFELADGGTLFLDEIGELPLELQAKLLRVLQEGEYERLGGKGVLHTDVRVIAATNRNLEEESAQGRFRSDLYYRLSVFPVLLPALRERTEDIPLLAMHFAGKFSQKMGKKIQGISNQAMQEMLAYHWPGNIRELEHIIERSVILTDTPLLELANPLRKTSLRAAGPVLPGVTTLREAERELIVRALRQTGGRIRGENGAARILDIEPTTLEARMKKLGIIKKHVVDQ